MRKRIIAASLVVFTAIVSSAAASDGEIVITHGKALAGDVTPGDAPGYPVTISQTGSYKLGSVIHPSANTIGIAVIAPDVTIDLNGFRMHGSTTAFFGITGNAPNVTIKNGTITSFKFDGIYSTGQYWTVENMQVIANGRNGVHLQAQSGLGRVVNNIVSGNANIGIVCLACLVQGNVVGENGLIGISTAGASILGNLIYDNGGVGASLNGGGFGQNTVIYNDNNSANQVNGGDPINPNYCYAAC